MGILLDSLFSFLISNRPSKVKKRIEKKKLKAFTTVNLQQGWSRWKVYTGTHVHLTANNFVPQFCSTATKADMMGTKGGFGKV